MTEYELDRHKAQMDSREKKLQYVFAVLAPCMPVIIRCM